MSEVPALRSPRHVPVLTKEVLAALAPKSGQIIVDCTLGAAGHARLIAPALAPEGRLIAIDQDQAMLDLARANLVGLPVTYVRSNFARLRQVLDELKIDRVDAVFADLGICSDQLDNASRGFSFHHEGPLDMRLSPEGETAADLIARLSARELADIFYHYGEEHHSRKVARLIVETREKTPITTTVQLAELVRRCVPRPDRKKRHSIDPATRVFQALRIAVNDELTALDRLLDSLPACLKVGGMAVFISFHSLEDRRVKLAFRDRSRWEVLTRKPLQAQEEEVRRNPRSRSAKLRIARYAPATPGSSPPPEEGDDD